jgi:hypothetical protein
MLPLNYVLKILVLVDVCCTFYYLIGASLENATGLIAHGDTDDLDDEVRLPDDDLGRAIIREWTMARDQVPSPNATVTTAFKGTNSALDLLLVRASGLACGLVSRPPRRPLAYDRTQKNRA